MGSLTDPIVFRVCTKTSCSDGSTRNDLYTCSSDLINYATPVQAFSQILWNAVMSERNALGGTLAVTPVASLTPAGGAVNLVAEIGIGSQPLATPTRYHLVRFNELRDDQIVSAAAINSWLGSTISDMIPINVYGIGNQK